MNILGIADNHDSGAALLVDGQLLCAVNQERIDRKKNSGVFPMGAIDTVLKQAGMNPSEVDRVVVGTAFTPSAFLRMFPDWHQKSRLQGQFSTALHSYMIYQSVMRRLGLHTWDVDLSHRFLKNRLKKARFKNFDLELMDHHRAHAEAAYRTQGNPNSLVLTVDAMGDGLSASAWLGVDGELRRKWDQSGLAAVNLFYSRITEILGFRPLRHEGKITGLAAYAPVDHRLKALMSAKLNFSNGRFSRMSLMPARKNDRFWTEVLSWSREEISAAAQSVLEDCVVNFIRHWILRTGCPDISVAGGVFANVRLNQKISELSELNSLWVLPHMGDGGLSVGAVLGSTASPPTQMAHAYLGTEPSENDINRALKRGKLKKDKTDILSKAAQILCSGGFVARCSGRMEWGPRALGNRSVFAFPDDVAVNKRLNAKLNRTEFMPFAPIVRSEDADRYFIGIDKAPQASRFMTCCFQVTEEFRLSCPGAVHIDNTARPQILRREDNPQVHALLTEVGKVSGTPVLINTSFNLHEEPIVCTADDAVRSWLRGGLDGLLIGNYLVT